jgi:hypothetical protein
MFLEPVNAVAAEDEPQLDTAESTAQSYLPIPVVDDSARVALFRSQE